jgi:hypothetical protein
MDNPICKGSIGSGTACGNCFRCGADAFCIIGSMLNLSWNKEPVKENVSKPIITYLPTKEELLTLSACLELLRANTGHLGHELHVEAIQKFITTFIDIFKLKRDS